MFEWYFGGFFLKILQLDILNWILNSTVCDQKFTGRCIASSGTAIPKKECFCSPGFFGQTCENYAGLNKKSYNPSDYKEIKLRGEDFKFLWRFVGTQWGNTVDSIF